VKKSFVWARMSPRYLISLVFDSVAYFAIRGLKLEAPEMRSKKTCGEGRTTISHCQTGWIKTVWQQLSERETERTRSGFALGSSIYDVFDQIVVVDNSSTDRTLVRFPGAVRTQVARLELLAHRGELFQTPNDGVCFCQ